MQERAPRRDSSARDAVIRWECRCQEPPVLLGTFDASGKVNLKVRDRYWHVIGRVWTVCPRCGAEHVLDPPPADATPLHSTPVTELLSE